MNRLQLPHAQMTDATDEAERGFAGMLALVGVAIVAVLFLGSGDATGGASLAVQVALMR
jgi:hypothetical protein